MATLPVNPTFNVNDFNEPKVLSPTESFITDVMMILFGKPGFYPSIPTLGMDISHYLYSFDDEIDTEGIKSELALQCSEFSYSINRGDMDIITTKYNGNLMLLFLMPIVKDSKDFQLVLGVTTNDKGEIIYNFVENETQII
jgi:hypothetical protein